MNKISKKLSACLVVCCLLVPLQSFGDGTGDNTFDRQKNRLIGYILGRQLPAMQFSDKNMDDTLAQAIFTLYIKQLDFQKRFLLQSDIDQLEAFAPYIDNNLIDGHIALPDTGYDILNEKIKIVEEMVTDMLESSEVSSEFNVADAATLADDSKTQIKSNWEKLQVGSFYVAKAEMFETDPEKLDFVKDVKSLKERWRKTLKTQLISQYLDLSESRQKAIEIKAANEDASAGKKKGAEGKKAAELTAEDLELIGMNGVQLWQKSLEKVRKRNKTFFQRMHQETLQDHYDRFFNCVARAFDPHTNYVPPARKEQFDIDMRGSLEGIGALLREDDGYIKVVRIIPGSASARQGRLKAEDTILQVAQEGEEPVDITDMRLRDAVRLIRGPKGEAVTLTVKKTDGTTERIRIIRDVVQIEETFVKHTTFDGPSGNKIGYIFIPSFYRDFEGARNGKTARNSTDDTRKAIEELKSDKVKGMILDLRDDGGGALVDAVDIAGLFIKSGPVVQVLNSFGDKRVLEDRDQAVDYDGPLVVLVNKFSASASEIVAAALQDYHRAVIVGGKHTHGKGTVQTIIDLNENIPLLRLRKYDDLGAMKVTIQKFYRVTGSSTQYKGVEPDIVLPNLLEYLKSGERYLDYSLPWDSIDPVAFNAVTDKSFDLDKLRAASQKRVAADDAMKIIADEAIKAEEKAEKTVIDISLSEMTQKRQDADEMREKVGAHYRKYREEKDDEFDYSHSADEDEDPNVVWLKNAKEDPYIREAVNIVSDIITR